MGERIQRREGRVGQRVISVLMIIGLVLSHSGPIIAQPHPYRIGVLNPGLAFNDALEGFRAGLAQLGYSDGKNIVLLIENAEGEPQRLEALTTNLLAASPDLIFTFGTGATRAAKQATSTVPIVFAFVADPLRAGLVARHASSQNNLTGISNHAGALMGKRLEFLVQILPQTKRLLALVAPRENVSLMSFEDLATIAPKFGIELVRRDVTTEEELVQTLDTFPAGSVDALFYVPSMLLGARMDFISERAKMLKLPLIGQDSSTVKRGALLSYGTDARLLGHQAAKLVTRIMAGTKPSEIPIQIPQKLLLTVNLTTARAIGVQIPREVLEITDIIIE